MTPETITLQQSSKQCAVQSTPVSQQEHGSHDRKRISCRSVIENACHSLEGGQRRFAPYLHDSWPIPARCRDDLGSIKIGRVSDRGTSDALETELTKHTKRKGNPDAFIAPTATTPDSTCPPHRND